MYFYKMIHDSLSNHTKHHQAAEGLLKAFQFLTETDLANTPLGTYKIDGDSVFAIVMEYTTKPQPSCIQEAHYKYIDVHYIISGAEGVGITKLTNQTPVEVNIEKDYGKILRRLPEMVSDNAKVMLCLK